MILNRIEYLSYYLAIPLFSHFLYLVFPEDFKRRMMLYISTIAGFFISIVLISDSSIYTFTIPFYHIFTLLAMSYFIYVFFVFSEAIQAKKICRQYQSPFDVSDLLQSQKNQIVQKLNLRQSPILFFRATGQWIFVYWKIRRWKKN